MNRALLIGKTATNSKLACFARRLLCKVVVTFIACVFLFNSYMGRGDTHFWNRVCSNSRAHCNDRIAQLTNNSVLHRKCNSFDATCLAAAASNDQRPASAAHGSAQTLSTTDADNAATRSIHTSLSMNGLSAATDGTPLGRSSAHCVMEYSSFETKLGTPVVQLRACALLHFRYIHLIF